MLEWHCYEHYKSKHMSTKNKNNPVDFDKKLTELESIVSKLESGEMPLEQALQHFEQGIKLTQHCNKALTEAEQSVKRLLSKDGELSLQDFATDETTDTP
jgi:exodeoxyribonuclease VII small subunit